MRDAVWRKLAIEDASSTRPTLAVGFLDLVGYTALSQILDDDELGALVTRFEALTHDTIAQLGGRLVKTIGDEVMFVSESPAVTAADRAAAHRADRRRQRCCPRRGPAWPTGR